MGMFQVASRVSYKDLVTGDLTLTVASGSPIQVHGILFDNHTGTSIHVELQDADGVVFGTTNVPACESFELQTRWIADKGLKIVSEAGGMHVTVFHNSPGN